MRDQTMNECVARKHVLGCCDEERLKLVDATAVIITSPGLDLFGWHHYIKSVKKIVTDQSAWRCS